MRTARLECSARSPSPWGREHALALDSGKGQPHHADMRSLIVILVAVVIGACTTSPDVGADGTWSTLAAWDGRATSPCPLPDVIRADGASADCDGDTCTIQGRQRIGWLDISYELVADETGEISGSGTGRFWSGACAGQTHRFLSSGTLGIGVVVQP